MASETSVVDFSTLLNANAPETDYLVSRHERQILTDLHDITVEYIDQVVAYIIQISALGVNSGLAKLVGAQRVEY